jgi:hypothetical protein
VFNAITTLAANDEELVAAAALATNDKELPPSPSPRVAHFPFFVLNLFRTIFIG